MKISDWFKAAATADAVAEELVEQDPDFEISDGSLEAMADELGVDRETFVSTVYYDLGAGSRWDALRQMFKKG